MESVEDEVSFLGIDARSAVVDLEGRSIAVRRDDHFDLAPWAGKFASVVDEDTDETIDGLTRCSNQRVLVAQLQKDETYVRGLSDGLESLGAPECNVPEIDDLIGVRFAFPVGTR